MRLPAHWELGWCLSTCPEAEKSYTNVRYHLLPQQNQPNRKAEASRSCTSDLPWEIRRRTRSWQGCIRETPKPQYHIVIAQHTSHSVLAPKELCCLDLSLSISGALQTSAAIIQTTCCVVTLLPAGLRCSGFQGDLWAERHNSHLTSPCLSPFPQSTQQSQSTQQHFISSVTHPPMKKWSKTTSTKDTEHHLLASNLPAWLSETLDMTVKYLDVWFLHHL